jgi:hypothetical protein
MKPSLAMARLAGPFRLAPAQFIVAVKQ